MKTERPTSILMTADTIGGVFVYTATLATELARRGVTVHVATMGAPLRPDQRDALRAAVGATIHESTFALEWMDDPWDDVARAEDWLRSLERELAPDVVHCNGYGQAAAGFRAPSVVVAHSCVSSWWEAVFGDRAPSRYDEYRRTVRRGLDAARVVVAPSRAMLDALVRHHGKVADGVVVPNGAAAPPAPPVEAGPREGFVLTAGRLWDPAKNVAAMVRVAPRLPAPLKLAGSTEGPNGERVDLGGVDGLGWVDAATLSRLMQSASVFALPARYEPFGLSVLEAAQRGCALVLGDIPSLRELWGSSAFFVPPDDDDAIVAAVRALSEDPALRDRLVHRSRTQAKRYSAAAMADGTLDVYRRALGEDPTRRPSQREPATCD